MNSIVLSNFKLTPPANGMQTNLLAGRLLLCWVELDVLGQVVASIDGGGLHFNRLFDKLNDVLVSSDLFNFFSSQLGRVT